MSSLKLSIKFDRQVYKVEDFRNKFEWGQKVRATLATLFDNLRIPVIKIYTPNWDTLKVLFSEEKYIEDVFNNKVKLEEKGFEAKLPMALKAQRTVVIHSFDMALTETHSARNIADLITAKGWKISSVFVLRSKRAFKIQFQNREETKKFLREKEITLQGIKIYQKSMEEEINPSISQCWKCGEINPGHIKEECRRQQICLKCNSRNHEIFQCRLPRETENMNDREKERLYCVPCKAGGEHCSLDHKLCPTKRRILQERIQMARKKKNDVKEQEERDQKLIEKAAAAMSNTGGWPALPTLCNEKQLTMASVITLAMIDEVANPGSFQESLDKACLDNNLSKVKYTPKPGTALTVFRAICSPNFNPETVLNNRTNQGARNNAFKAPAPPRTTTSNTQRWLNDEGKNKRTMQTHHDSDDGGAASMDESLLGERAAASNFSKKSKQSRNLNAHVFTVDTSKPTVSSTMMTNLKTSMDESILKFIDDSTVGACEGLRNFTVRELHDIFTSRTCQNSPNWKQARAKETATLLKDNHGDIVIRAKFISVPEQDFQSAN